jgi:hypothetical protein
MKDGGLHPKSHIRDTRNLMETCALWAYIHTWSVTCCRMIDRFASRLSSLSWDCVESVCRKLGVICVEMRACCSLCQPVVSHLCMLSGPVTSQELAAQRFCGLRSFSVHARSVILTPAQLCKLYQLHRHHGMAQSAAHDNRKLASGSAQQYRRSLESRRCCSSAQHLPGAASCCGSRHDRCHIPCQCGRCRAAQHCKPLHRYTNLPWSLCIQGPQSACTFCC